MSAAAQLKEHIEALAARTRERLRGEGLTRQVLGAIRQDLIELAAHSDLLSPQRFALPPSGSPRMYLLYEDQDEATGQALYVNVCGPGVVSPPHDHATWAVIAGIRGVEHNTLYRLAPSDAQGAPALTTAGHLQVRQGEALALLPDEIHSIDTREQPLVMCLHHYGRGLPRQTTRRAFLDAGPAGVAYAPQPEIVSWPGN